MTRQDSAPRKGPRLLNVVVLLAGLWLLVGWWLLGYEEAQRAIPVAIGAGLALVVLAGLQLIDEPNHLLSVLVVWVGVGLLVAPFVLRYGFLDRIVAAYLNQIIVGVIVLVAGFFAARWTTRPSSGASSVRRSTR